MTGSEKTGPDDNPNLLFVYGTLLSAAHGDMGREERVRLQHESLSTATASVSGRIYDLGRYPGLVLSNAAGEIVYGEVVELRDPRLSLPWLDAYEGIVPGEDESHPYTRLVVRANAGPRRNGPAWAYVYRQSLSGKPVIASGRWLDR